MTPNDPTALVGTWKHSHEEDADGLQVYRPASTTFPPSRGRDGFALHPGGALTNLGIAAGDGTAAGGGTWAVAGDVLQLDTDDPHQRRAMKVVSVAPDKLVVAPAPAPTDGGPA